jgi:uncharacterized protein YggE
MLGNPFTIESPFGVSVFGSALLKVSPDQALIRASVTRVKPRASDSFLKAKDSARAVADFLRVANVQDFGTSRITLSQEKRVVSGEIRLLGYKAIIGFTILVKVLDQLEDVVAGVIEAGANEIAGIEFQNSSLKQLRMQARRLAIDSAREKAQTYSEAGGRMLGNIIHIEDVHPQVLNPQLLQRHPSQARTQGQSEHELVDYDAGKQTLDPGAIEVAAAVLVAFSLEPAPS